MDHKETSSNRIDWGGIASALLWLSFLVIGANVNLEMIVEALY